MESKMRDMEVMQVKEVANYFSCHPATIWRMTERGQLPKPIRIGGKTRWIRSEIEEVVDRALAERDAP